MEDKRKRALLGILMVFILIGVAIFIVLAAGTFWYHFPEPVEIPL